MFTNSSHIQIYNKFNKAISNTVCAFLNTDGGHIFCFKNGKYFPDKNEAESFKDKIKSLLEKTISNYKNTRINYSVVGNDKSYFVDILVHKSAIFHKVINTNNYYIRSGKKNKQCKYELFFDIRQKTKHKDNYIKYGNFAKGNKFYKYMTLENALQSLRGGNIWFVEPSKWNDKYEEYFYKATIDGKQCSSDNPIVYTTCVTNKRDSESAWKIYTYNTQGLASRCVEFILNREKLRDALIGSKYRMDSKYVYNNKLTDDYIIYEGTVIYKDEQIIEQLPKPKIKHNTTEVDNEWYHAYFDKFSFDNYMNLMLLKRNAFEHEQETRLFVVKKVFDTSLNKDEGHIDIQLSWKDIIEGVRYDANCSNFEKKLLEEELKKVMGLDVNDDFDKDFIFKEYDVYKKGHKPATITTK